MSLNHGGTEDRAESRQPNPGSDAAIAQGCSCPVMDNGHGRGRARGDGTFVMNTVCPLHGFMAGLALQRAPRAGEAR